MSGKGGTMLLITDVAYFKPSDLLGLSIGCFVEGSRRSLYVASKEEGDLFLDVMLRRNRFSEVLVHLMRADLEASNLAPRITDVEPEDRCLVSLLNLEGVIAIRLGPDDQLAVACDAKDECGVNMRIEQLLGEKIFPEDIRASVVFDRFNTPFVEDDAVMNVVTVTV